MGRLTDKQLFDALNEHEKDCCRCRERICTYESDRYNCLQDKDKKVYKELAEYRSLEEQGLLLKLPCKVGDTFYHLEDGYIYKFSAKTIEVRKEDGEYVFCLDGMDYRKDDFGKIAFLTEKEAIEFHRKGGVK